MPTVGYLERPEMSLWPGSILPCPEWKVETDDQKVKSQHPGCFLRNQSPQLGEGSGGPINLDLSGTGVEGEDLVFAFQDRGSEEGTCNHRRFKKVKPKDAQFAPGRTLK